jgi:hypothetical protein
MTALYNLAQLSLLSLVAVSMIVHGSLPPALLFVCASSSSGSNSRDSRSSARTCNSITLLITAACIHMTQRCRLSGGILRTVSDPLHSSTRSFVYCRLYYMLVYCANTARAHTFELHTHDGVAFQYLAVSRGVLSSLGDALPLVSLLPLLLLL